MFYVYAGSFKNEHLAIRHAAVIFDRGYDCLGIQMPDGNIRVQVGEFVERTNAVAFRDKLNREGIAAFWDEEDASERTENWQLKSLTQNTTNSEQ